MKCRGSYKKSLGSASAATQLLLLNLCILIICNNAWHLIISCRSESSKFKL